MRSLKELAENLNVNFKAENRKIEDKVYVPDIFENITTIRSQSPSSYSQA